MGAGFGPLSPPYGRFRALPYGPGSRATRRVFVPALMGFDP
jgi:hypothetical protein